jgi:Acetyltransferase (GNAT) domain
LSEPLQIISPLEYPGWDDLVISTKNYSFFHSSAWARTIHHSYGYRPFYFTAFYLGKISILIPIFGINSILTGRRGVSLPFSDHCQILFAKDTNYEDVLNYISIIAKKHGWKYIEFRGGRNFFSKISPSISYFFHTIDLTSDKNEIFSHFRDSTKRNILKSLREGVNVRISTSYESLKRFYLLNCSTRKRHGLPPQPFSFFRNIYEYVLSRKSGFIALGSYRDKIIAGAVFFYFGDKAIYKYGASDDNFQKLRPNNLVMWDAIKWCKEIGIKNLNFGRTDPRNSGLLQFKRGWRGKEEIINYYKYIVKKGTFVEESSNLKTSYGFFKSLPSPVLNAVGSLFYRHVG